MAEGSNPKAFGTAMLVGEVRGLRTRVLLILAMAGIIAGATVISLLAIRIPLDNLVIHNLSSDLLNSVATFENLQSQRMVELDRENELMAALSPLKAMMTTSDVRTIEDGALGYWKLSGSDLFALADRGGRIMAAYSDGAMAGEPLRQALHAFASNPTGPYLVSGNDLFYCSIRPLYFGSRTEGTILGYVISGFAIDRRAIEKLSRTTGVEATFLTGNRPLASSLKPELAAEFAASSMTGLSSGTEPLKIVFHGEPYLSVVRDLTPDASAPLKLVELKSLADEERSIRQIDRLVLSAGMLALVIGTLLMVALSRAVTRPLEELAAGVRAFASGDSAHLLPYRGTREVRELSSSFAGMRREILQANQAVLESERLATIGRMASSVSHDLRHYLAAVYANSEFLASSKLSEAERIEILAEIRSAVNGTTELLESLLIFGRSGTAIRRTEQFVGALVDRVAALIRSHPDASGVHLMLQGCDPSQTGAVVDAKQIERAVFNLVLNACQAPRSNGTMPAVGVKLAANEAELSIEVLDNGDGVPAGIRETLFEPFVSEGKHKGSGLGLTLTQCIAAEHGGSVMLVCSRPGETIFRMTIARGSEYAAPSDAGPVSPASMGAL